MMAVALTGREHYRTEIAIGNRTMLADEPLENGGAASGPTPTELLAASLASCTSITLRMYADRKGIEISQIRVDVRLTRDESGQEAQLNREIRFDGSITKEQETRLLQIANACPVSRLLSGNAKINTIVV